MEENKNSGYDSTKKRVEETAENFEQQAKHSANEFKEGWNEATNNNENKKVLAGVFSNLIWRNWNS
jgi:hypothetical protein